MYWEVVDLIDLLLVILNKHTFVLLVYSYNVTIFGILKEILIFDFRLG